MRKTLLISIFVIVVFFLPSGGVSAHSNLVRSDPANGSVLPVSPSQITFEYSEAPDPNFSSFQIVDAATQQPLPSTVEVDPSKPKVVRIHFASLKNGVYSRQWKVRSAVDGHVGSGSITFSIGQPQLPLSLLPPPDAPDPATVLPSWIEVYLRWLSYASLALGLGSVTFAVLVWRPAVRRSALTEPAGAEAAPIFIRSSLVGLIALGVFSLASIIYDAVQAGGNGPLATGLNPPPADLTQHAVVGIHPDGQLFDWISHGYPNSAMPAFAESLTDQQRWDLVNFIRTLVVKK